MDIYKCPNCNTSYLYSELFSSHCSENYVGPVVTNICKKCLNKRPPQISYLKQAQVKNESKERS